MVLLGENNGSRTSHFSGCMLKAWKTWYQSQSSKALGYLWICVCRVLIISVKHTKPIIRRFQHLGTMSLLLYYFCMIYFDFTKFLSNSYLHVSFRLFLHKKLIEDFLQGGMLILRDKGQCAKVKLKEEVTNVDFQDAISDFKSRSYQPRSEKNRGSTRWGWYIKDPWVHED